MSHHANDAKIYKWTFKDIGVALGFDWRPLECGRYKVYWVCRPDRGGGLGESEVDLKWNQLYEFNEKNIFASYKLSLPDIFTDFTLKLRSLWDLGVQNFFQSTLNI